MLVDVAQVAHRARSVQNTHTLLVAVAKSLNILFVVNATEVVAIDFLSNDVSSSA